MPAPVILFGYNRPELFEATLMSLRANPLAESSDLFIYIDGPRNDKDIQKILKVKEVAEKADGFRSKTIICSDVNKGLAKSIISGITEVIGKYGRAIILEDDLYLSRGFLTFMNSMLDAYEGDDRVFQISGFGTKASVPSGYDNEFYLSTRAQSWSWATWKDRWESIDWEIKDYGFFMGNKALKRSLLWSGSEFVDALRAYASGEDIWYICFMYNMFRQNKYCITPVRSLVRNDGFGAMATHTLNYNRFKVDFDSSVHEFRIPQTLSWNRKLNKSAVRYWTVPYRIYGKIRTIVSKLQHRYA